MTLPFTRQVDRIMRRAEQEADHFGHEYVGTEHILLGLAYRGTGVTAAVLLAFGAGADEIRRTVERVIVHGPPGEWAVIGRRPRTPGAASALAFAADEARGLGDEAVGPEHLLLGLTREAQGVAAHVLLTLGADHGAVRAEILRHRRRPVPAGWRTEAVVAIARGISAEGAYDRLPVLADALEDAGCDDPEVLGHARQGAGHGCRPPGCWVIDRLLADELGDGDRPAAGPAAGRPRPWWRFWG